MQLDSRQFTYSYFANIAYERPGIKNEADDASRPNGRLQFSFS